MPQRSGTEGDAIRALYIAIEALAKQVRQLQNTHSALHVKGDNTLTDGDSAIWVDNNDNKIHYVINGVERTISHD